MSRPVFQLDYRLQAIADQVTPGSRIADIGTDHALLPIWLCRVGRIKRAVAADINEAPLRLAQKNIQTYRCEHCVAPRLSDGLSAIAPDEADEIIVAGMGGEVIAGILDAAPWVRHEKYRLILQPMSASEKLRTWLMQNGFALESEAAVRARQWIYSVMTVRYTGEKAELPEASPMRWIGKLNPAHSMENRQYIRRQRRHIMNIISGLNARGESGRAEEFQALSSEIESLLRGQGDLQ